MRSNNKSIFNSPKRWLESATLMTWGSFFARSLSLVVIIPLALNRLTAAEIAVWLLFTSIITLQMLVDLGFTPTFTRIFAYGMSGVSVDNLDRENKGGSGKPNWDTVRSTIWTVNFIFTRLGILWFLMLLTIGTLSVYNQINFLTVITDGWIAWGIIVYCSFFIIRGNKYVALLQGMNKVALLRRWEIVTSLGASITMIAAILFWRNLIAIVAAHQVWQLINISRNKWLIAKGDIEEIKGQYIVKKVPEIFAVVWSSTWRSGLGMFMSYGLIQLAAIYFAQVHTSIETAKFLFALRLIQTIVQFSQGPFYSKIPALSMLYAANKRGELIAVLRRSMFLSYLSYVFPFTFLFFFGEYIMTLIGSQIAFPERMLWLLFGICYFIERFGAMHVQIYSLSNKIIWHIANGVSGVLFTILLLFFEPYFPNYSIPLSLLLANLLFYSWYSCIHSYKILDQNFYSFEGKTSFVSLLIMVILLLYSLYTE